MSLTELANAIRPFLGDEGVETITRLQVEQLIENRIGVTLHRQAMQIDTNLEKIGEVRKSVIELEKKFTRMELEESRALDPNSIKLETIMPTSEAKPAASFYELNSLKIDFENFRKAH